MSFTWSFTSWSTYNTCPAKYKFKYEQRLRGQPPGPAAARGIEIHDSISDFIVCKTNDPSKLHGAIHLESMLPVFNAYREHRNGLRFSELPIYINKEWKDVIKGSPDRWGVMILDAVRVGGSWQPQDQPDEHANCVSIAEWKSGTPKDDHEHQRSAYALAGMARYPQQEVFKVTTYYVEGKHPPKRLTVKQSARVRLQALWTARLEQVEKDLLKAPRPGMYCRWCDYAKDRGGPCMF